MTDNIIEFPVAGIPEHDPVLECVCGGVIWALTEEWCYCINCGEGYDWDFISETLNGD